VAYLRRQGICIFLREATQGAASGLRAHTLAQKILYEIFSRAGIHARVGIGGIKHEWRQFTESYYEARLALAGSEEQIASVNDATIETSELSKLTGAACQLLAEQKIQQARLAFGALPGAANHQLGASETAGQRIFFFATFESLCLTALRIGCDQDNISRIRTETLADLAKAGSSFSIQTVFLESAEMILGEVHCLFRGKTDKIIERVRQMIDRRLKSEQPRSPVSLAEAADALAISTGHLSRTFRRATGTTFQEYSLMRRMELAKRLLLDPLTNVASVSSRCGFATPAYFARVFRRIVGCSPTDYIRNPQQASPRRQSTDGFGVKTLVADNG